MQELQETQVQSLNQEDLLEKEMAAHSSIPAWEIPWTEEPGGLEPTASQGIEQTSATEHTRSTSPGHFYPVMSDSLGPGLEPVTITTAQSFVCLQPAPCWTGPSSTLASSLVLWWVTFWGPSLLLSVGGSRGWSSWVPSTPGTLIPASSGPVTLWLPIKGFFYPASYEAG